MMAACIINFKLKSFYRIIPPQSVVVGFYSKYFLYSAYYFKMLR